MSTASLEQFSDEMPVRSAPGIIPRPGFQNRRNKSQYLKNLYPAGFGVNNVRRELLVDQFPNRALSPKQTRSGQLGSFSFTGWTRGGMEDSSSLESFSCLEGDGDPFADCAGPTLRELTAMKSSGIKKSMDALPEETSCLVSRCTLHTSSINRSKRLALSQQPPKVPVYHAPAYLPGLSPAVSNTRVPAAYERWLHQKRDHADDKAWYVKGNNEKANYSSHLFGGSQSEHDAPLLGPSLAHSSSPALLPSLTVPMGLPESIAVEIHTSNQVLRARSTADHSAHYAYKLLPRDFPLRQVKIAIVQDIVRSIQHAFAAEALADASSVGSLPSATASAGVDIAQVAPSQDSVDYRSYDSLAMNSLVSGSSSRMSISVHQLDLVLHYFHPGLQTWRPLDDDSAWTQAKYLYAQQAAWRGEGRPEPFLSPPPLQLMYALEPQSEQQLLREIEAHAEQRRQQRRQVKEHISIAALTDALQTSAGQTGHHRSWISSAASSTESAGPAPALSTPSKRNAQSASRSLLSAGPSILYPKPNAKLQSLAERGATSHERLQAVAKQLEQQILRTKW